MTNDGDESTQEDFPVDQVPTGRMYEDEDEDDFPVDQVPTGRMYEDEDDFPGPPSEDDPQPGAKILAFISPAKVRQILEEHRHREDE